MWFRRNNLRVENLQNGDSITIRKVEDARMVPSWEVVFATTAARTSASGSVLGEGYKSEDEAVAVLDDFLSAMDIEPVTLQPPMTEEELEEDKPRKG